MKTYDAIVVGSGCAGLAAALEMIIAGKKHCSLKNTIYRADVHPASAEADSNLSRHCTSCAESAARKIPARYAGLWTDTA